jgi:hypothetical protein
MYLAVECFYSYLLLDEKNQILRNVPQWISPACQTAAAKNMVLMLVALLVILFRYLFKPLISILRACSSTGTLM